LLRTEASPAIGFGHLSRCLTLASAFREHDVACVLALSAESAKAASNLEPGLDVRLLDVEPASAEDAAATALLARTLVARALVADHYGFRESWLSQARDFGLRCAYIDDFGSGRYECDAVLNHNVYAEGLLLDAAPSCIQLLGPSYALVRAPFRMARERRSRERALEVPERVLLTLGGSDATGTTLRMLSWLSNAERASLPAMHVRVVLGPAFQSTDEARALASVPSAHHLELVTNVADLSGLCEWADLVVTAAGVTCLEVACVGVPMLAVCLAENQRKTAHGVAHRGMALNLGEYQALTQETFLHHVMALRCDPDARHAMVQVQLATVDGHGPERAAAGLATAFV
jgi:UDP-2,4-diacetamido-2,4,6-trideoxy-beta-L-altropyranose hydrolase